MHNKILTDARLFMGSDCKGDEKCGCCGEQRAGRNNAVAKVVGSNFSDFSQLLVGDGRYICDSCKALLADSDMRFKPLLFISGEKRIMPREDVLTFVANPPAERYVITLPYNFKKHHWLYAGLSTEKTAYVGTDNRTVVIDYDRYDVASIIETVRSMVEAKVPRKEIISGVYSTFTLNNYSSTIREWEAIIAPVRHSGFAEMIVKYTPKSESKTKIIINQEAIELNENEAKAVELLCNIAQTSSMRANSGMQFWSGFFTRRVNKYKSHPFNQFASELMASVGASTTSTDLSIIALWSDEEKAAVMNEIQTKSDLLVALSYSRIQKRREFK